MREEDKQDDRIITTLEPTGAEQRWSDKQSYRLTTHKYKKKTKKKENYQTNKTKNKKKLQIDYPKKKIPQRRRTNL